MVRIEIWYVLSFLALVCSYPAQGGNLLVNGGFEDPVITPGTYSLFTPGQVIGSSGWVVLGNSGANVLLVQSDYSEPQNNIIQANSQQGSNSLDLSGYWNTGPSAGVGQWVSTTPGQTYSLSFYVGRATPSTGAGGYLQGPATIDLLIDGGRRLSYTNSDITLGYVNWMQFNYTFQATNVSTWIAFYNDSPDTTQPDGTNEAGLDSVVLTEVSVPEPSAVVLVSTLMIPGGIWILRRRVRAASKS